MASDNLTALSIGLVEGLQKTGDLFIQDAFARRRKKQEYQDELSMKSAELGNAKSLAQYTQSIKPGERQIIKSASGDTVFDETAPAGGQIGVNVLPLNMMAIYDANGNIVSYAPKGSKQITVPKSGAQDKADTKSHVTELLGELKGLYNDLDTVGGAVNTEKDFISNLRARAGASGVGQAVSGALGTKTQSIRNQIEQKRPLLINAIRQATGMSARAMDSNVELKFYLQAATSPGNDIQANTKALHTLDKQYGSGTLSAEEAPAMPVNTGGNPKASDLKVGANFGGGKIKAVRWK